MALDRTTVSRPPRAPSSDRRGSVLTLLGCLVIAAAIATLEGVVSMGGASDWFWRSAQVIWTPAPWLARIVWALVFLLLAVAGWRIWRLPRAGAGSWLRGLHVVALGLVTVWPPVYLDGYPLLGPTALWLGFATAFLLVAVLAVLIGATWRAVRVAAVLLIPAAVWIGYVTTVNFGDAVLASLG